MLAEWSVECAPDDPVLVVPWSSDVSAPSDVAHSPGTSTPSYFIDLRENPYDLDHLPEAEHFPPLMHALRALNAPRSPVFTAKCDAWTLEPEELETLRIDLDQDFGPADPTLAGFASYIDILLRERSFFTSSHAVPRRWTIPTRCSTASSARRWSISPAPRKASASLCTSKPSAPMPS